MYVISYIIFCYYLQHCVTKNTQMSEAEYLVFIGKNITRIRKAKGLTIKELGFRCDMEHSNIIPIEKGKINITFNSLYRIAGALEVDVKDFFKG